LRAEKDRVEDLNLQPINSVKITNTQVLTEEERKRYLKLWRIMYFTVPLIYLILTLIFK